MLPAGGSLRFFRVGRREGFRHVDGSNPLFYWPCGFFLLFMKIPIVKLFREKFNLPTNPLAAFGSHDGKMDVPRFVRARRLPSFLRAFRR